MFTSGVLSQCLHFMPPRLLYYTTDLGEILLFLYDLKSVSRQVNYINDPIYKGIGSFKQEGRNGVGFYVHIKISSQVQ